MRRWRLARITGGVLVLGTLIAGCGMLAFAEPQRPWYDVEAQQAAWAAFETKVLVVGGLLVALGVALGVAGGIGEAGPLRPPEHLREPRPEPTGAERDEPAPDA